MDSAISLLMLKPISNIMNNLLNLSTRSPNQGLPLLPAPESSSLSLLPRSRLSYWLSSTFAYLAGLCLCLNTPPVAYHLMETS